MWFWDGRNWECLFELSIPCHSEASFIGEESAGCEKADSSRDNTALRNDKLSGYFVVGQFEISLSHEGVILSLRRI
jgi:hypothetical protein